MTTRRLLLLILFLGLVSACHAGNAGPAKEGSPQTQAWHLIDHGALLLDVRSADEFESGHVKGADNIPHDQMDAIVAAVGDDLDREVVVYCRSGRRSGLVKEALEQMGYTRVHNGIGYQSLVDAKPARKPKS